MKLQSVCLADSIFFKDCSLLSAIIASFCIKETRAGGGCNKLLKKDLKAPGSRSAMGMLLLGKCSPYAPIQALRAAGIL